MTLSILINIATEKIRMCYKGDILDILHNDTKEKKIYFKGVIPFLYIHNPHFIIENVG